MNCNIHTQPILKTKGSKSLKHILEHERKAEMVKQRCFDDYAYYIENLPISFEGNSAKRTMILSVIRKARLRRQNDRIAAKPFSHQFLQAAQARSVPGAL